MENFVKLGIICLNTTFSDKNSDPPSNIPDIFYDFFFMFKLKFSDEASKFIFFNDLYTFLMMKSLDFQWHKIKRQSYEIF